MRPDCNLDLRSLRFFLSLYKTSSFAKTGHEFGMSPATVQRTIDKLREAFEDKLFERRGLVMVPTAKARRIATELSGAMAALERVGEGSDDFADRSVVMRISTFDNATIAVLVPGVEGVREKAPNIRWQFLQADEHMFDHLRNGNNDFALFARQGVPDDCYSETLLTTPYAWVVRKGHPLEAEARKTGFVGRQKAVRFPQIIANAHPDRRRTPNGPAEGWFAQGAEETQLFMPFFLAAPFFLERDDAVTLVPAATAKAVLDPDRFAVLPAEPGAPELTIRLAWHAHRDNDPYHRWVRSLLIDAVRKAADNGKTLQS